LQDISKPDTAAAGVTMADTTALDAATKRLALALDALEAAVERRSQADRGEQSLESQLHALSADRSRLAAELDSITARSREIEGTNREIARRIDVAIDGIRSVLEANDH
jgi:septal ring factor EnvC (AmiA/AmiB activator)